MRDLIRASRTTRVTVSGIDYRLLTYPVRFSRAGRGGIHEIDNGKSARRMWVVGLLVPSAELRSEARRISLGAWGNLPLFAFVVLLAIPGLSCASSIAARVSSRSHRLGSLSWRQRRSRRRSALPL